MLKFLINCGIWIIPIIICFVVSIFIIIERIIFYSSINKNQDKIVSDIRELVAKGNYDGAKEYCRAVGTPLASIMKKAIELHDLPVAEIREGVTNEATLQMPRMERFLSALGTIANISTLLGLLGTVTGNIAAFGVLSNGGSMGDPAALASAIAEALGTTASGLVVSIPSIIFHNFFASKANKKMIQMEGIAADLILLIEQQKNKIGG
ncbi:MAG: MotA/TolQ/ExbB proton channel family protein [Spirochaetales bacterium]|nr:MotA/TolQ/ExbB proton channel family protein [Spirochaetales bacterium]